MNDLGDLIAPEAILPRVIATSRRHALQTLCEALARTAGVNERVAFDAILLRERNKGTGVGDGVAIPHAHVPGLSKPIAAFARLDPAQDFEADDGRPADLVFMLLAPPERSGDHLKALARVSRLLRRADMREKLRNARSVDELYALMAGSVHSDAA
jgi:PTS system nitrogen regulatory IIA component